MLRTTAIELAALGSLTFGTVMFAIQAIAFEGGRWFGRRKSPDGNPPTGGGVVIGSMLGLLGFVLALTLSHASARFEERRQGTLEEANAIGTAWLRAGAVGHPKGDEIAVQLRQYAQLRLAFVQADRASGEIGEINDRTSTLQSEIWRNLSALTRERSDPVAALFMASLNEAFDRATSERFAFNLAMPPQILLLITLLLLSRRETGQGAAASADPDRDAGLCGDTDPRSRLAAPWRHSAERACLRVDHQRLRTRHEQSRHSDAALMPHRARRRQPFGLPGPGNGKSRAARAPLSPTAHRFLSMRGCSRAYRGRVICAPSAHSGTRCQSSSGLNASISAAARAVAGPRSCSHTTSSWLIMKVLMPVDP